MPHTSQSHKMIYGITELTVVVSFLQATRMHRLGICLRSIAHLRPGGVGDGAFGLAECSGRCLNWAMNSLIHHPFKLQG